MSRTICCPVPTAIESVVTTLNPCPSDVGQVVKMIFWRNGNTIASEATALISTTWTTLLAATGDTKAVVTPFVANVIIPASEAREFGGGNETPFGAPIVKGSSAVVVTATMYSEDQDVIAKLKQLECENLEVLFINESNQLIYSDGGSTTVGGFDVIQNTMHVSDKAFGGFTDPDTNMIRFSLKPGWSDTLEISQASTFLIDSVNA